MSEIYYKVVLGTHKDLKELNVSTCKLESSMGKFIPDSMKVEYKLNEWTYPKVGKLFVFSSLLEARRNKFCNYDKFIFECECLNPTVIPFVYIPNLFQEYNHIDEPINKVRDNFIKTFWIASVSSIPEEVPDAVDYWIAPANTVICDGVKLIRQMD
jgi:hypothetical protein